MTTYWVGNGTKAEWAAYNRERRKIRRRMLMWDSTLATHGKDSTYVNWGCTCDPCSAAHRAARRKS